jgi:methylmalonyl-CoA epimerase
VLLLGSSLKRVVGVSRDIGLLDGVKPFIAEDEYGYIPRDKVVVILTGSQGEPRAALAKLSRDEMRNVALPQATRSSFRRAPFPATRRRSRTSRTAWSSRASTSSPTARRWSTYPAIPAATSCRRCTRWTRPKVVVPVHGEPTHLTAHKELAEQSGIKMVPRVRNGDILRLAPGPVEVIGEAPHGRIFKDGTLIGDFEEMGIGDRKKLSYVGHVALNVVIDSRYDIIGEPDIVAIGLPIYDDEGDEMEDTLYDAAISAIRKHSARPPQGSRSAAGIDAPRRPLHRQPDLGQEAGRDRLRHQGLTMLGRVNHVAIAVPDLAAAVAAYRDTLGATVSAPQALPEHGVTVVFVELPNTKVELLEPLGERIADRSLPGQEPVRRHAPHLLRGGDILAARDHLVQAGARVLGDGEPKTARMASRCSSCTRRISSAR